MRRALLAAALLLTPALAHADAAVDSGPAPPPALPADASSRLRLANAAATLGDWRQVTQLVAGLVDGTYGGPALGRADRAEALRLLGLAEFFRPDLPAAERLLLAYLRLELDARLDPSVIPPEAITFFEDVRARHAAELRALRPRQKRYWELNFLPTGGQIQNGDTGKAIAIGVSLGVLLATDIGSYALLRHWCGDSDHVCDATGTDHTRTARDLRWVNIGSGVLALGVYAYGVIDGFTSAPRRRRDGLAVLPVVTDDGVGFAAIGRF